MRIRTIKPEFFNHEGIFEAEVECKLPLRIAYVGLWCAADREGRFKLEPRRLGIQILPYDGVDFSRVLHALATRGFIVLYCVDDAYFGVISSFLRHQIINNKESASILPDPDEETSVKAKDSDDFDAYLTRGARQKDALTTPDARKGREGKGKDCPSATGQGQPPKANRPRNEILDTLVEVCGGDLSQTTQPAWSQASKALSDIRQVAPDVTKDTIKEKAFAYRKAHPDWELTPTALSKHWGSLTVQTSASADWVKKEMELFLKPVVETHREGIDD